MLVTFGLGVSLGLAVEVSNICLLYQFIYPLNKKHARHVRKTDTQVLQSTS